MQRRTMAAAALGTAMTLALVGGTAEAGEYDCGDFTVAAGEKTTNLIDNPPAGDSPGDVRILTRALLDSNDDEVGVAYMASTLAAVRPDGEHVFMGDFHFVMRDGLILGKATYERPNDTSEYTDPMTVIIVGGSGAYDSAEGTVEISAGEHPTYTFKLVCEPS